MPGTYGKIKHVLSGELITADDRNNEHDNHITYQTPGGTDDYSVNTGQMQTTVDPYPASVASLATDLSGELARLRYLIAQITGGAQWYIDPVTDLTTLINGTMVVGLNADKVDGVHATDLAAILPVGSVTLTSSSATKYCGIGGNGTATTDASVRTPIANDGTIKKLYVNVSGNNIDVTTTVTLFKNGSATALTVSYLTTVTGAAADTTHSVSVAAGDLLSLEVKATGAGSGILSVSGASMVLEAT